MAESTRPRFPLAMLFLAYCELDRSRCLALIYLAIDFGWRHLFVIIQNIFREEESLLLSDPMLLVAFNLLCARQRIDLQEQS